MVQNVWEGTSLCRRDSAPLFYDVCPSPEIPLTASQSVGKTKKRQRKKEEEAIQCPLLAAVSTRGSRVAVVVAAVAKPLPLERRELKREREREREKREGRGGRRECKRSRTRSSLSLLTLPRGSLFIFVS
jgi:hypothetical protein